MAKFKIDDIEYDTEKLDGAQKKSHRALPTSFEREADAVASLEISRAARIEIGNKMRDLVIDKK